MNGTDGRSPGRAQRPTRRRLSPTSEEGCPYWALSDSAEQRANTCLGRGMTAEKRHDPTACEWLDDEHVRGCRIRVEGNALGRRIDLAKRIGETVRGSGDRSAAGIGGKLARAGDRHLNQERRQRRKNDHRQERNGVVAAFAVVSSAAVPAK